MLITMTSKLVTVMHACMDAYVCVSEGEREREREIYMGKCSTSHEGY
jgi:hypothetical protein